MALVTKNSVKKGMLTTAEVSVHHPGYKRFMSNNFGRKHMEKMGWESGQGLGRRKDGRREHVKVKLRSGNLGIGAEKQTENFQDIWWDHMYAVASNSLGNEEKDTGASESASDSDSSSSDSDGEEDVFRNRVLQFTRQEGRGGKNRINVNDPKSMLYSRFVRPSSPSAAFNPDALLNSTSTSTSTQPKGPLNQAEADKSKEERAGTLSTTPRVRVKSVEGDSDTSDSDSDSDTGADSLVYADGMKLEGHAKELGHFKATGGRTLKKYSQRGKMARLLAAEEAFKASQDVYGFSEVMQSKAEVRKVTVVRSKGRSAKLEPLVDDKAARRKARQARREAKAQRKLEKKEAKKARKEAKKQAKKEAKKEAKRKRKREAQPDDEVEEDDDDECSRTKRRRKEPEADTDDNASSSHGTSSSSSSSSKKKKKKKKERKASKEEKKLKKKERKKKQKAKKNKE